MYDSMKYLQLEKSYLSINSKTLFNTSEKYLLHFYFHQKLFLIHFSKVNIVSFSEDR